ncbi:MAG: cbb3-type cytochrome c oxidase subunit I, partial [Pseudomonadota bacterium]
MRNASAFISTGIGTLGAVVAAALAQDSLFAQHMSVLALVLGIATIVMLRMYNVAPVPANEVKHDQSQYMDGVIRYGIIAATFWGVVGFLVGVVAAAQLAWPDLNIQPWFNFGRIRPLHTSAVIFAFGGTALITASLYIVQRTCRARLWGGDLAWFVFWGYQ